MRECLEIEGLRLKSSIFEIPDEVLININKQMAPEGKILVPKLYKMLFYQKGGHFKPH